MPMWNVLVPVVELVQAKSAEEAIAALRQRLSSYGFEPYDGEGANAYESERQ